MFRRPDHQQRIRPQSRIATSGWFTPGLIATLCLLLLVASWERGRGNLHKIMPIASNGPEIVAGPGGQAPLRLARGISSVGGTPEFTSATFLPGRGMNLMQITAQLPDHGSVELLDAPSVSDLSHLLTGQNEDLNGALSTSFGGAFLFPFAGRISGTQQSMTVHGTWQGNPLALPGAPGRSGQSVEGLLLTRPANSVSTQTLQDGQSGAAHFSKVSFGDAWPGTFDIDVQATLAPHTLDLTWTITNVGTVPAPVGMGWQPHFAVLSGHRANLMLTVPSHSTLELSPHTGLPTGRVLSADNTPTDFTDVRGRSVGTGSIDTVYTRLQSMALSSTPEAELRDPNYGYSLRLSAMTPNTNAVQLIAPDHADWISIAPATNLPDPLGTQWSASTPSGLVTLAPGQTFTWSVRLTIAPAD